MMDKDEAFKIASNPEGKSFRAFLQALHILSEPECDAEVPLATFLNSLRYSERWGHKITPPHEIAALTLYRRSGRTRKANHVAYEDFVTDADDWERYLDEKGLL
jgi:hypothetical protein